MNFVIQLEKIQCDHSNTAERCIVMEISVIREEMKKIVPAIQEIIMAASSA